MDDHSMSVLHEMHKGAQRFVFCECECGWQSPWLPIKTRSRLPTCGRVRPFAVTAEQQKLMSFYDVR